MTALSRVSYHEGPVKLDRESITYLVERHFPNFSQGMVGVMVAIVFAESGGVINIIGDNYASGHQEEDSNARWDDGLASINSQHGYDRVRLLTDPSYNIGAAAEIHERQGFGAWATYNDGSYREHLEQTDELYTAFLNSVQMSLDEMPDGWEIHAVLALLRRLDLDHPEIVRAFCQSRP